MMSPFFAIAFISTDKDVIELVQRYGYTMRVLYYFFRRLYSAHYRIASKLGTEDYGFTFMYEDKDDGKWHVIDKETVIDAVDMAIGMHRQGLVKRIKSEPDENDARNLIDKYYVEKPSKKPDITIEFKGLNEVFPLDPMKMKILLYK